MISLQYKFLFIHIPKTGGNSIQNILHHYSEEKITASPKQDGCHRFGTHHDRYPTTKHSTLREYRKHIEPEVFHELYKFSTLRNPWSRMISAYFSPHMEMGEWDRRRFVSLLLRAPTARKYVNTDRHSRLAQELDYVISFERLNEDFACVCRDIGIPFEKLPVRNKSVGKHYSHYYDETLIELVRQKFWEEIEYGGYEYQRRERGATIHVSGPLRSEEHEAL